MDTRGGRLIDDGRNDADRRTDDDTPTTIRRLDEEFKVGTASWKGMGRGLRQHHRKGNGMAQL